MAPDFAYLEVGMQKPINLELRVMANQDGAREQPQCAPEQVSGAEVVFRSLSKAAAPCWPRRLALVVSATATLDLLSTVPWFMHPFPGTH